eukprot:gnl/MRDRNA2_/MRDRNA2_40408_c0_seq1.p1 gnl/MRDRNA2_/MRDRNA2_40408_c0~~gnl/MRDRNA2_/MRDRNA2_40408_c0_seq1.p1  ORF type:complete len:195 (+),score=33.26 gnl/MRDRNA2_/MRDRNA2_40408_c0_seq1:112-696(+)
MSFTPRRKSNGSLSQQSPYGMSKPSAPIQNKLRHQALVIRCISEADTEDEADVACDLPLDLLGLNPMERAKRLQWELDIACGDLEEQHEMTMKAMDDLRRLQNFDLRHGSHHSTSGGSNSKEQSMPNSRRSSKDGGTGRTCSKGVTARASRSCKEGLDQAFSTYLPHLAKGKRKTGDVDTEKGRSLTVAQEFFY